MAAVTPSTPNTTSPRDILVGYQLRRENRALLDAFEEQKAKFLAQAEIQKQREEEIERKIQQVEQQNQQITEEIKEKMKEMGEHLREHDVDIKEGVGNSMKEIEESVVKQLSARLSSGKFMEQILMDVSKTQLIAGGRNVRLWHRQCSGRGRTATTKEFSTSPDPNSTGQSTIAGQPTTSFLRPTTSTLPKPPCRRPKLHG